MGRLDELDPGLRALVEGTASATGKAFFEALVKGVGEALGVREAFVSEFADSKTRVRILADWDAGHFIACDEYDLEGTPCEAVLGGEVKHYPRGVAALFPHHGYLAEIGAESYLAIPLVDAAGAVLGHLAVIDVRPMPAEPRELALFRVFGARAAAELERLRAEQALRDSEARLAAVLDSALDAVICVDEQRRITLLNPAAERVFRCEAAAMTGLPIDPLLTAPLRALLGRGPDEPHLWAPQGLSARRAGGEEFPVELTLSSSKVGGRCLHTLILRDLDERRAAEATIARLVQERRYLEEQVIGPAAEIVGESAPIREVRAQLAKVAATDSTVLLLGETGTGKELLARYLHQASPRSARLLVKMNCAALPAELIESELFGHEKGAFSGAIAQRKGRFELADGGSLFLDEVGELSLPAQAKLLRVLQEREFERVGGTRPIRVDVRVIAATNRDLELMVGEGSFRADLYYRLDVFPVRVPPLRERAGDVALLARAFLGGLQRRLGKPVHGLTERALARLCAYPWPGNIRELNNVLERAAILAAGPLIDAEDLGLAPPRAPIRAAESADADDGASLEALERRHIERVLEACRGVIEGPRGAAAALGLNPSTLRSRMQKLGIRARR